MASERKCDGVSRCGVWPASATTASRAPRMPGGDRRGAIATGRIQRAGDDQRRGANLRQAVVEGLHGPLPRPPQARRESGRPVAEALGAQTGGAAGWQRGMAGEDRFALPLVDEGIDPVALEPFGARVVRGPARLPLGRRREARGRAFEDERVAPTVGCATARRRAIRAPSE